MAAKLIAEEGLLKGLILSLEKGDEWIIGRDPDQCQLLVEDPSASRKHLVCRNTDEGIEIENLSDTNPIEVNEQPVNSPRVLHHGDSIKIGNGIFRFYTDTNAHVNGLPNGENQKMVKETANSEQKEENTPQVNQDNPEASAALQEDVEEGDTIFDVDQMESEEDALAQIDFGLIEAGRWFLKVISGPNTGAEFSMQPSTSYVIGTDPATCDIVFHDASVSRQHARLSVGKDDILTIEDLKSKNGTFIEDQPVTGQQNIVSNSVVTIGTTAFVVLDREGKRDTIISPLLPSIVKVLQQEESKKAEELKRAEDAKNKEQITSPEPVEVIPAKPFNFGGLMLMAMITGLLIIVGIGTTTLFRMQEVVVPQLNVKEELDKALAPYPSVKYSFNKTTGRLLLVGHVLTAVDRTQLLYNLQGLNFIKNIDANIIIDEYVWQEQNQVLSKNLEWRGITFHAPTPGHFVITGYLKSRKQADQLSDYLSQNFQYLDLLEKRIVVEEDLVTQINVDLQEKGFREVAVQVSNGEVSLSGAMNTEKSADFAKVVDEIKAIPGVRNVNNFVVELAPEQSVINITSNYEVTGSSHQGQTNYNVIIKGRILSRGDVLDGMTITSIKPNAVFLEKEGVKYRIDYNK